jgi:hypothetical protein
MASEVSLKVANVCGHSLVLDRFARFPNKTTAKVAGLIAFCAFAKLAQKRAATTRKKKQMPSLLIRMADRGGICALTHSLYYVGWIAPDYKPTVVPVKLNGKKNSSFMLKSAGHGFQLERQMLITACISTALVFFKYNRAAMTTHFLSEVLLSYRSKDNRKAVREFAKRSLPQQINDSADARKMLGFTSNESMSLEKIGKRHYLLTSFCHALATHNKKNALKFSGKTPHLQLIKSLQTNLKKAKRLLDIELS